MRALLKQEEAFKERYCQVNHITSRKNLVSDEEGEIAYTRRLKKQ